jgi:hypothetical protein
MSRALALQVGRRDPAHFVVDEGDQRIERRLVSIAPAEQCEGDL